MKDAIRECYSTVIRELAAIVNAPQTDDMLEKELLPRDPVMENVSRIREAMDKLSAAQHADARGGDAVYAMFRAIVDAGGPTTIARHGVEKGADKWAETVRAGMLAIERKHHPERFDWSPEPPTAAPTDAGREDAVEYPDATGWAGPGHARVGDTCPACPAYESPRPKLVAVPVPGCGFSRLNCEKCGAGSYGLHYPPTDISEAVMQSGGVCPTCYQTLHVTPAGGEDGRDGARLDWLAREYWRLDPFDMPTGAGDADVGWRVLQYHGDEPRERIVAEVYTDDPRAAIDAAIAAQAATSPEPQS